MATSATSSLSAPPSAVGLFGGTFNPVHIGHLRTALELREALGLARMHLVPCAIPPHRQPPGVTAAHRLAMLAAAVDGEPGLVADDRELRRAEGCPDTPSYTIDTLVELRNELGAETSICLCVGMDSLLGLASWHRWQELLDYVHLVVAARPGWRAPDGGEIDRWVAANRAGGSDQLRAAPAGRVWLAEQTPLPVSSTGIRDALVAGRSARYLLPDPVINYIERHRLYR